MNERVDLALKRRALHHTIRDAAIAEFAELGLRGASTQGIADRAGISKTKLHYHITSKEDLYAEALTHIIHVWSDLFHDTPSDAGPQEFLRAYIARKIRFSIDHPAAVKMYSNEVIRGAPLLRDHWETSRGATTRAALQIAEWVEKGLIRPVDCVLLQFNIWALTQFYALHAVELRFMLGLPEDAEIDVDHVTAEVAALVWRGLAVTPPDAAP
jgi:AcrR family transcriptional regulator